MTLRGLKILGFNIGLFVALLLVMELACQAIALVRPTYEVLFLAPDRSLGWTQVPNLRWTWAGWHWYAADYSVDVQTNALGFRDRLHQLRKPRGTRRVALLGDSFLEAVQVPLEETGAALLERGLNRSRKRDWEVLNFGISNYGVGQFLLTWETHARLYDPDYVAIFVGRMHLKRTTLTTEFGAFAETRTSALWVRPSFRLEDGHLVRVAARDYAGFVEAQARLLETGWSEGRSRRRKGLILPRYARLLEGQGRQLLHRLRHGADSREGKTGNTPAELEPDLLELNARIIEVLGEDVAANGGRLVVLDASKYFGNGTQIAPFLKELCQRHGFGYLPLYESLLEANRSGTETIWEHDRHFNRAGNRLLAEALLDWLELQEADRR